MDVFDVPDDTENAAGLMREILAKAEAQWGNHSAPAPAGNLKAVQALKDGKPRISLVPGEAICAIAHVLTEGATRYAPWNWLREPAPWSVYLDALRRHLDAWAVREDNDARTGFSHLAHAGANLMILLTLSIRGLGEDDRQP